MVELCCDYEEAYEGEFGQEGDALMVIRGREGEVYSQNGRNGEGDRMEGDFSGTRLSE